MREKLTTRDRTQPESEPHIRTPFLITIYFQIRSFFGGYYYFQLWSRDISFQEPIYIFRIMNLSHKIVL